LYHAAWWVPDYLDFDESRALAVKAIWALGGTPGAEAEQALERLLGAEGEVVREAARAQLARQEGRCVRVDLAVRVTPGRRRSGR
jgi:hypothetical protein